MDEESLRDLRFNRILDQYLTTGTMPAEDYASLNGAQKTVIQCIKRAFARITSQ